MENIYSFLRQKMMHTTDQAMKLLDTVLKLVYDNPDKFCLSISDLNDEDPFIFLHITCNDITKGIIGKLNTEDIVSRIHDKDLLIYESPEEPDKEGYFFIEITSMLESTEDIEYLHILNSILQDILNIDKTDCRLLSEKAQENFEDWSFNSLDSETKAIIYNYKLLKSETKNILNSYDIDDELYAQVYDWLDYNADVDGFALSYDKEELEEFLRNL